MQNVVTDIWLVASFSSYFFLILVAIESSNIHRSATLSVKQDGRQGDFQELPRRQKFRIRPSLGFLGVCILSLNTISAFAEMYNIVLIGHKEWLRNGEYFVLGYYNRWITAQLQSLLQSAYTLESDFFLNISQTLTVPRNLLIRTILESFLCWPWLQRRIKLYAAPIQKI